MALTEKERGSRLNNGRYQWVTCYLCGLEFGMPEKLYDVRLADHQDFWCPLGHQQHYLVGKTEAQVLQERLESQRRATANADERYRSERASHIATKGQLTKAKKRAANGVCPCCSRSFSNVARHVASQHPEHVAALNGEVPR